MLAYVLLLKFVIFLHEYTYVSWIDRLIKGTWLISNIFKHNKLLNQNSFHNVDGHYIKNVI